MKKTLLTSLVFAAAVTLSIGQTLSIEPAVTLAEGPVTSTDIGAHALVTNITDDTLRLLWTREVIASQQGWTSWICDLNNCYLPHVEACPASKPNILPPGESIDFQVHINPGGIEGDGEIHVSIYDMSDPDEILGVIQAVFETGTSSVSDIRNASLRIYPNPATSYFQLTNGANVDRLVIYALVGNRLRDFDARSNTRFDVSDLPQGIYLVHMLDSNQQVLKTVRLSKR